MFGLSYDFLEATRKIKCGIKILKIKMEVKDEKYKK